MFADRGLPVAPDFDGLIKTCRRCGGKGTVAGPRIAALFGAAHAVRDVCPACRGRAFVIIPDRRLPVSAGIQGSPDTRQHDAGLQSSRQHLHHE